jgi:hypothetical protein
MLGVLAGAYCLVILTEAVLTAMHLAHLSWAFPWRAAFSIFVPGTVIFEGFGLGAVLASMPWPAGDYLDQKTGKVRTPMVVHFWTALGFAILLVGGTLILFEIF